MWQRIKLLTGDSFCLQLMKIMVKVSDISNEARPMEVAEPWLDCLLQEFFNQVRSTQDATGNCCVVFILTCTTLHTSVSLSFLFCWQSDTEKLKGLPVAPFMDRDKVSKPSSQTNFIRFVLLPLFSELTKLFPCLEVKLSHLEAHLTLNGEFWVLKFCCHVVVQQHIVEPVRRALEYYSDMERAAKEEEEETRKTWGGRGAADQRSVCVLHPRYLRLKCV